MADYDSRHASQIRAVAQVHESIKGICERIGLDVEAAERFSKDNGNFVLPWYGEAHPRALINSVLPNLAEKEGGQDRHGLNGCRSVDMAEHLSGAKIAGIGTLPEFGERDIEYQRKNLTYLTIRCTNDNKNRPEIDPIDEEELSPEGDLVLPGRN